MAVQVSKSISLTDYKTGEAFKLSANQIIYFMTNTDGVVELTYSDNRNNVIVRLVTQSAATINTAAARTQMLTFNPEPSVYTYFYIHSDKIIFIDEEITYGGGRLITYDALGSSPIVINAVDSAASLNTAAGNTFRVAMQSGPSFRWINNLLVNAITSHPNGSEIMYDAKGTENFSILVEESPNAVQTAINAL